MKTQRDFPQPTAWGLQPAASAVGPPAASSLRPTACFFTDRLGSTRVTETIQQFGGGWTTRNYYPFGEEIGSTANDQYKFASTYRDSATGLDYAINRYYASSTGRFLNPDPYKASGGAASPQSWNRYAYVVNDPVNHLDPTGLFYSTAQLLNSFGYGTGGGGDGGGGWGWGGGGGGADLMEVVLETNGPPLPEVGGGGPTVIGGKQRDKILEHEGKLIAERDCSEFVTSTLQAAFLAVAGTGLEQLGSQRSVYDSLGVNSVNTALANATFYSGGTSPTTTIGNQTYTTNATANYAGSSVTFYSGFFDQDSTGRAQAAIHEGMHLVLGFTDRQFAQVWGVYREGMSTQEASAAWSGVLKQHCN
jgi:RHS repeat-associated protein